MQERYDPLVATTCSVKSVTRLLQVMGKIQQHALSASMRSSVVESIFWRLEKMIRAKELIKTPHLGHYCSVGLNPLVFIGLAYILRAHMVEKRGVYSPIRGRGVW